MILRRIIHVIIAGLCSSFIFDKVYNEFYSYLPNYETLQEINTTRTAILKENTMALRELYNHAFQQSILYAVASFILIIAILEYINWSYLKSKSTKIKE